MSNRLKLFRERMAAFEGAADPIAAIKSGYYVHAPGKLLVDEISGRIALRPSSSHLLLGGIGSGKTTQLLVACEQINKIEDTHAIYVDVTLYTDISVITRGVLTAIVGLELAKLMKDSEDEDVLQSITLIRQLAEGYTYYDDGDYDSDDYYDMPVTSVKGIIPKKSKGYGISLELVENVGKLAKATSEKYGNFVILFDGLDRLDNVENFIEIVFSDAQALSSFRIGLVLVGPLTAIYGKYRAMLDEQSIRVYYQPSFDVDNDTEAYDFFREIIKARSSTDFIEERAIKSLIHFSGGVLRDFISLTQTSIEETYKFGQDIVQEEYVLKAVNSFSKSQWLGVSDDQLKVLKKNLNTETFTPRTDEDIRLLVRRLILEYREPKIRYVVHPAIKMLIKKISV